MDNENTSTGIGFGVLIAALLSWAKWHSIFWVIVNGVFSWLYVIYYLIVYGFDY